MLKFIHIENKYPPTEDNIMPPNCNKFLIMIIHKKTGQILKLTGKKRE